ncbi:MAG: hypothetical protein GXC94_18000 [Comamonadaceae bacterium]|nr:hypothetical protein [Comamonadaceae bacterium]
MKPLVRTLIVSTLVAATGLASAGPRGYGPGPRYHHHGGAGLGGLVLGLALAVPLIALASQADRAPDVVYVPPPPLPPAPAYVPSRPAPVIYPRNGQSQAQIEFDQRECNRWATTQPAAMADSSVFNRAVDACMDGRGYTLR